MINVGTCARDLKFLRCNVEHSLSSQAAAKTGEWVTTLVELHAGALDTLPHSIKIGTFMTTTNRERDLWFILKIIAPCAEKLNCGMFHPSTMNGNTHNTRLTCTTRQFFNMLTTKNIANCVLSHHGKVSNFDFTYTSFHSSDLFNCRWNIWTVTQCKQFK